jgi:hypothetical protein
MSMAPTPSHATSNAIKGAKPPRQPWSLKTWLLILLGASLIGIFIYIAFNWYEIVEEDEWVGAQGEAATNPYYAFERFLSGRGLTKESLKRTTGIDQFIAQPDAEKRLLILGDRRLAQMSASRVAAIADWVQRGGHLFVEAEQAYLEDPLLKVWGVDRRRLVWQKGKLVERPRVSNEDEEDALDEDLFNSDKHPSGKDKNSTEKTESNRPPDNAANQGTDSASKDAQKDSSKTDETEEAGEGKERKEPSSQSPSASSQPRTPGAPVDNPTPPPYRAPNQEAKPLPRDSQTRNSIFARMAGRPAEDTSIVELTQADNSKAIFSVSFFAYQNIALEPHWDIPKTMRDRQFVSDHHGGRVMQLKDGKGHVTVLSNFDLMVIKSLGENDNAEFVWHLLAHDKPAKPIVGLALKNSGEGFMKWAREHAWMVVISAIVLLLIWIWNVLPRFGPMRETPELDRRSLREHLDAAGRFLTKYREWAAMVGAARTRVSQHITRQHPRVVSLLPHEQARYIAEKTGATEADIARILFSEPTSIRDVLFILSGVIKLESAIQRKTLAR